MISVKEEQWYFSICDKYDSFCKKIDEKLAKEQQQLKAFVERNELHIKLASQRKLKAELTKELARLNSKSTELENACNNFAKLSLTDNDKQRLDNSKEVFELAKELTGVRIDFSAPPDVMKGYIKNEKRKLLLPFKTEVNPDLLWDLMNTASDPSWSDKENHNPN